MVFLFILVFSVRVFRSISLLQLNMDVHAKSYQDANTVQRRDAFYVINKYLNRIQWRNDGKDSVLDIGSATGDVTNDYILPILPKGFKKLVGVDIAEDMIGIANKRYANSKVSFEKWDMDGDVKELLQRHPDGFDHIFCMYSLHWSYNLEQAVRNIYDLLRPDGNCVIGFLGQHDYLDVVDSIVEMPKWSNFKSKYLKMPMPYRYVDDCENNFRQLLKSTGFKTYSVEVSIRTFSYDTLDEIRRNIGAVNSCLKRLTPEQGDEYFRDFVDKIFEMGMAERIENTDEIRYNTTYTHIEAYAQKNFLSLTKNPAKTPTTIGSIRNLPTNSASATNSMGIETSAWTVLQCHDRKYSKFTCHAGIAEPPP